MLNILFERVRGISSGNSSAVEVQIGKCCRNEKKERRKEEKEASRTSSYRFVFGTPRNSLVINSGALCSHTMALPGNGGQGDRGT